MFYDEAEFVSYFSEIHIENKFKKTYPTTHQKQKK